MSITVQTTAHLPAKSLVVKIMIWFFYENVCIVLAFSVRAVVEARRLALVQVSFGFFVHGCGEGEEHQEGSRGIYFYLCRFINNTLGTISVWVKASYLRLGAHLVTKTCSGRL